jgi:hypothetical protein
MLLRCDFDSAKTRGHLFGRCPEFAKKLTLVERIRWFEYYPASPSFNHACSVVACAQRPANHCLRTLSCKEGVPNTRCA